MAAVKPIVAVLIVAHLFSLAITTFRLKFRHSRECLWFDDAFAALVAVGGLFIVGVLISTTLHTPIPRPIEYRINLTAYFFILWACRASLVMATGRLVHKTYWPKLTPLFWLLSGMFLCTGAAFTILAIPFCRVDHTCSSIEPCFCKLDRRIILCALVVDIFVDIATLSTNWYIFIQTQKKFKMQPTKKWLVYSGLSSNILMLIINVAFWALYLQSSSESHLLVLSMTNAVMIISSITCNSSTVVGIICRLRHSGKRASISVQGTGIVPQAIALTRMSPTLNKIEEAGDWDVVSQDTALACIKGDWVA